MTSHTSWTGLLRTVAGVLSRLAFFSCFGVLGGGLDDTQGGFGVGVTGFIEIDMFMNFCWIIDVICNPYSV